MSITCKELNHIYNEKSPFPYAALHDINLDITEGIFTAIIGETGSGKSTLVQHLNALLLPTSGTVEIDDFVVSADKKKNKNLKQLRKKVGLVFQFPEYQLFEETIMKDIVFGPKNFEAKKESWFQSIINKMRKQESMTWVSAEEERNIAKNALEMVGLDESYLDRSPFELSGGQKRRVAIAGILAINPEILILDEPTAGLDPQGAFEMMELFKNLNRKYGKTIIMVTHDMEHVFQYCKEVVVLKQGSIKKKCTTTNFFKDEKLLEELDVSLPSVIQVKKMLKEKGIDLSGRITSLNTLVKSIKKEVA